MTGDPAISLVTLTVTEAGYTTGPGQEGLDLDDGELAAHLDGRPPLLADCVELGEICRRGGVRAAIRAAITAARGETAHA
jgi:hypothetical protein